MQCTLYQSYYGCWLERSNKLKIIIWILKCRAALKCHIIWTVWKWQQLRNNSSKQVWYFIFPQLRQQQQEINHHLCNNYKNNMFFGFPCLITLSLYYLMLFIYVFVAETTSKKSRFRKNNILVLKIGDNGKKTEFWL